MDKSCHAFNNCNDRGRCNNGTCICAEGFSGNSCDRRTCPQNCNSRSMCDFSTGVCTCLPGFDGLDCGIDLNNLCPNNCNKATNNGHCIKTGCKCHPGYGGRDCGNKLCPKDFSGKDHGSCDATTGLCQCTSNYTGADCGALACPGPNGGCSDHGKCVEGVCVCNKGWGQEDCSRSAC